MFFQKPKISSARRQVAFIGHLPKAVGGRQSTGASIVEWQMANSINRLHLDYEVQFIATDVFLQKSKIEDTIVYGWNKKLLIRIAFMYPFFFFYSAINCLLLKLKYNFEYYNSLGKQLYYYHSLSSIKPAILHIHNITDFILVKQFKSLKSVLKVFTVHAIAGLDRNIPGNEFYRKMECQVVSYSFSKVIFVSTSLKNEWEKNYGNIPDLYEVILNGINGNIFRYDHTLVKPRAPDLLRLLSIGTISDRKGQIRVLHAIAKMENKDKFQYLCIGDGSDNDRKKMIDFSQRNGINFEYLGYLEPKAIVELLHNVDFMILPSSSEGFGLVFIESLAVGTPIIIPKNLPIVFEDEIINNENCILLDDHTISSITKCLHVISERKDKIRKNINFGIHSWELIAQKYVILYDSIS